MAIEVRIPTILRSYTGGAKVVEGSGDSLGDLLSDLDSRYSGLRGRLITDQGALHRFVNVYVNDEDVRFLGSLDAKLSDGDTVTILPAVAGGAFGLAAAAAIIGHSAATSVVAGHSAATSAVAGHGSAASAR
ncbi:MoaD family protein [Plantactinospora sp. B5E13]|uniref:MoaD family protein n=1 Tax=unclassified Plantactinospora TaxID=2631981 RepID=UPI00325CA302